MLHKGSSHVLQSLDCRREPDMCMAFFACRINFPPPPLLGTADLGLSTKVPSATSMFADPPSPLQTRITARLLTTHPKTNTLDLQSVIFPWKLVIWLPQTRGYFYDGYSAAYLYVRVIALRHVSLDCGLTCLILVFTCRI